MSLKNSIKKIILFTMIMGSMLEIGASRLNAQAVAAAQSKETSRYIFKGEGRAKHNYIYSKMYPFFHPKPGVNATPRPFVVPDGYTYAKGEVQGAKFERLTPIKKNTDIVLIQMHGGGYVQSLGNGHRNLGIIQSQLAGGAEVYYLDYKIAPQYKHPSALEDAVKLYRYLLRRGYKSQNIVFIGDSAGGNLVLTTALYLRDHKIALPKQLILISPWGTVENTLPSRAYNYNKDLVLGRDSSPLVPEIAHSTYGEGSNIQDPYLSPIHARDFIGLPPMLIQAGSYETLFDDSILIAGRAEADGVKVQFTSYKGMPHDFALLLPDMKDSVDSFEEIRKFIMDNK